ERVIGDPDELAPSLLHAGEGRGGGVRLAALMSVPGILGITPTTVPQNVPYLAAEPPRVAAWRERLGPRGFKIGIAWQNAVNAPIEALRSIPLASFAPLADIPGVRLISLQKGRGED